MGFDDGFANGQPKPGAGVRASLGFIQAKKPVEDALQFVLRNAGSRILDFKEGPTLSAPRSYPNLAVRPVIQNGVGEEVDSDLVKPG